MRRGRGAALNKETGEVYDVEVEIEAEAQKPKRRKRRPEERKMFGMTDLNVMSHLDLTPLGWRILWVIQAETNMERGYARLTGGDIAATLHSHQPTVAKVMTELIERKVIFKLGNGRYRVNHHIMWRGSLNDWDDATDIEPKPILERA